MSTPVEITLANGTEREQRAREQLLGLFESYPLDKWRYTDKVRIEERVIPHSHPVLTLNTLYIGEPEQQLAEYIHEQMHWFTLLAGKSEGADRAIGEFRELYPGLPVERPEGCGSEFSNYLHVAVNYLEYLGLAELLGEGRARELLGRKPYYTSIYRLVLDDTGRIGEVMTRHGAVPPERPPEGKAFIRIG